MARLARVVIPGMPHHITQRGNRRQQTFFNDEDYAAYLALVGQWCRELGVQIWCYCLKNFRKGGQRGHSTLIHKLAGIGNSENTGSR